MRLIAVAAVLLMAGCATSPPLVQRIPYDASYFADIPATGTGVVEGQLFLTTRGGDVKFGAGEKVMLNPITPMSQQWYQEQIVNGNLLASPDPRYAKHSISTQADGEGRFRFESIPPGDYYLVGKVTWQVPHASTQGGFVAKEITVKNGSELTVMLTL